MPSLVWPVYCLGARPADAGAAPSRAMRRTSGAMKPQQGSRRGVGNGRVSSSLFANCPGVPRTGQNTRLAAQKRLVLDPVWLVGLCTQPRSPVLLVLVVGALEPDDLASRPRTRACGSRSGRGTSDRARSRRRSPAKSTSASSSARSVSTSRSLVGSSSRSTLPPERSSFARWSAVSLAARQIADSLLLVAAAEVERGGVRARVDLSLARARSCPCRRRSPSRRSSPGRGRSAPGRRRRARPTSPDASSPSSADSSPAIIRKSVVLPAPFGADDADDAARRQRERQVLDEQPVAVALGDVAASTTTSPEPRAGRDVDLDPVELDVRLLGEELLVGREPGLRLRVAGPRRHPHPLQLAGQRPPARRLLLLLDRQPRLLLLEPRGVVALEGDAVAAVELEDPAGDVVEEVAVVGDRERRCRRTRRGTARARRPTRRRGGSSARRAAAGRATTAAARQSATRRRSPPESVATSASPGGQRSASMAVSSMRSRFQASVRSIRSCTSPCSSSSAVISSSDIGSANRADSSSNRWSRSRFSATPSSTFPRTSFAGSSSGSCGRKPTVAPGASRASPEDGSSSPAMMRSSVDLPAPFGPRTPILAPGRNDSEMSRSTCLSGPWNFCARYME